MIYNKLFLTCALVAIGASLQSGTAQAQVPTDAGNDGQDFASQEIIVTAQKRSESANSVPLSITALSGRRLDVLRIVDVAGLAKVTPGFSAADSGYGTPVYFLRGVGFFDTSLAAKPTVSVYIDEIPLAYSMMAMGASFDLERVEVLKGPQGTLFGSNSTGGAINYISAKPTSRPMAGLSLSYGRFNRVRAEGFASGPLSDTLSARVAVLREAGSEWQKSYTRNDRLGERDFSQGRLQLAWKPTSALSLNLMVNAIKDSSDTQAPQLVAPFQQSPGFFDPRLPGYPLPPKSNRAADWGRTFPLEKDNSLVQVALRGEYALNEDTTLTSITSYARFKEKYGLDADGTSLILANPYIVGDIRSFTQELRVAGSLLENGSWIVGGNYEHNKTNELTTQYSADLSSAHTFDRFGLPSIDQLPQAGRTKYRSLAVFADVTVPLSSTLSVSAGARYTDTKIDFSGCTRNGGNGTYGTGFELLLGRPAGSLPLGTCVTFNTATTLGAVNGSLSENNVSWRGVLHWKPASDQLIYASVGRGYKAGSFPVLGGNYFTQYIPVKQEQVTAYEIGIKSTVIPNAVQINTAFFYSDYKNKQLRGRIIVPIFNALEALVNVPKSRVYGAELQANINPFSGMMVNLGASYTKTKVTSSFVNYTAFGQVFDFKGTSFPYTPKWQLTGDAQYDWRINEGLGAFVGANYARRTGTYGDFKPDPRMRIRSYGLLDLRAGIEDADKRWRVSLYGQNVTDQYYWITATRRGDVVSKFTGMPVTYGISFDYRFGER